MMIAAHSPSFGFWTIVKSIFNPLNQRSLTYLEEAFSSNLENCHAIWLPSARAGICWALQSALSEAHAVVAPAFTCRAVHEGILRSGNSLSTVDAENGGFLMEKERLIKLSLNSAAVVLCEVFGHTYDLQSLSANVPSTPYLRVIDMAMSLPSANRLNQLGANDFAVISFGIGKSMYAGYGAIGFAKNAALASEIRRFRDTSLQSESLKLRLHRLLQISSRTATRYPSILSTVKRIKRGAPATTTTRGLPQNIPPEWSNSPFGYSGLAPSTTLDRNLAILNSQCAEHQSARRILLANQYKKNLVPCRNLTNPEIGVTPLSHYSIRVPAENRDQIRNRLKDLGVEAATLWELAEYLNPASFPNASLLGSSVLNLPLSSTLSTNDIDFICDALIRSVNAEIPEGKATSIAP